MRWPWRKKKFTLGPVEEATANPGETRSRRCKELIALPTKNEQVAAVFGRCKHTAGHDGPHELP